MTYNSVDYGISEDRAAPYRWRYTIYPKPLRGGPQKTVSSGADYSSYSGAEAACKQEIDLGLSGAHLAKRS
jgi:hypothetical protein